MPAPPKDDEYERFFHDNYNTELSPEEVTAYEAWVDAESKAQKRDVRMDQHDYDLRGAWRHRDEWTKDARGHGTDRFKKPNHPTFSDQSVYHGTESPWGWTYEGGTWGDGTYTPSRRMFVRTHDRERMKEYMDKYEPKTRLILPD